MRLQSDEDVKRYLWSRDISEFLYDYSMIPYSIQTFCNLGKFVRLSLLKQSHLKYFEERKKLINKEQNEQVCNKFQISRLFREHLADIRHLGTHSRVLQILILTLISKYITNFFLG